MIRSGLIYPRRTLLEFSNGVIREKSFLVSEESLSSFVIASGDRHPLHTSKNFAQNRGYPDVLVHGMCISAHCSSFIAEEFVGSHGLLVSISADFRLPVFCNELLTWRGEVLRVDMRAAVVQIKWMVLKNEDIVVQLGTACVWLGSCE